MDLPIFLYFLTPDFVKHLHHSFVIYVKKLFGSGIWWLLVFTKKSSNGSTEPL